MEIVGTITILRLPYLGVDFGKLRFNRNEPLASRRSRHTPQVQGLSECLKQLLECMQARVTVFEEILGEGEG